MERCSSFVGRGRMGRCCLAGLLSAVIGCAPAYQNREMKTFDPQQGYRFNALEKGEGNTDRLFVCLTFSGGGTRAAALAYGVLQGLRETQIPGDGTTPPRRLLDEVDVISSVSGGSFTAAGYGLWGEELFDGRFERRFLRRDVQSELILQVLSPVTLLLLPLVAVDRIDIASAYYHDHIFEQKTYADLIARQRRPFIVINATNIAAGRRFEFTQDDFDILGSDLASVPVGYAVAGSSAFPLIFSPLRLKYYCCPASSAAIERILRTQQRGRRVDWAQGLLPPEQERPANGPESHRDKVLDAEPDREYRIHEPEHRYLYLLDGGLADNLGLSYVLSEFYGGIIRERIGDEQLVSAAGRTWSDAKSPAAGGAAGRERIERLVVIVVNAGNRPPEKIEALDSAPGLFQMGYKAGTVSMENYSQALVDSLRYALVEYGGRTRELYNTYRQAMEENCPSAPILQPPVENEVTPYVIEVSLRDVRDPGRRGRCLAMPTSFYLPKADVDDLIELGKELMRQNDQFQQLLRDLGATP